MLDDIRITRISSAATRSEHELAVTIDSGMIALKASHARVSGRRREIHTFHQHNDDTLQRMLNAIQPGSYIRPHRHLDPPKAESVIVLQGALACAVFDDTGALLTDVSAVLDPRTGRYGMDLRAGVWHTFLALEPDTVIFEVKPGPYCAASDKDFASWAPPEGAADASTYLAALEDELRTAFSMPARAWRSITVP